MEMTKQAKREIESMAQGKILYAMNAPNMKGYAFNLDKEGNLYSGMFVSDTEEAKKFEYQGFCSGQTLEIIDLKA